MVVPNFLSQFTQADQRIDEKQLVDEASSVSIVGTNVASSKDPLQCIAEKMPVIEFDNFGAVMSLENVSKKLEMQWNTINDASNSFGGEFKAARSEINCSKNRFGILK